MPVAFKDLDLTALQSAVFDAIAFREDVIHDQNGDGYSNYTDQDRDESQAQLVSYLTLETQIEELLK